MQHKYSKLFSFIVLFGIFSENTNGMLQTSTVASKEKQELVLIKNIISYKGINKVYYEDGKTLFLKILEKGSSESLAFILQAGADITIGDRKNRTLMEIAYDRGPKFVDILLSAGVKDVESNISDTTENFREEEESAESDYMSSYFENFHKRDEKGNTRFHKALAVGDGQVLQHLIDSKADLTSPNGTGQSPLEIVYKRKDKRELLLMAIDKAANEEVETIFIEFKKYRKKQEKENKQLKSKSVCALL